MLNAPTASANLAITLTSVCVTCMYSQGAGFELIKQKSTVYAIGYYLFIC